MQALTHLIMLYKRSEEPENVSNQANKTNFLMRMSCQSNVDEDDNDR